jgi:hypothetical protein
MTTGPVVASNGDRGGSSSPPLAAPKPPWYRRRAPLVGAAVVAILAFVVISDLPLNASVSQQASQEATVITAIRSDDAGCVFALQQAYSFYDDVRAGTLPASDGAEMSSELADDEGACSFTSESIYDLSGVEVPGGAAGRDVGNMVNTVTLWVTSDALAAIIAIEKLTTDPRNPSALNALAKAERLLASDRATASSELAAADHVLGGAHLQGPGLPSLPVPKSSAAA